MLKNTGHEEISLSSLSSGDYSELKELVTFLIDEFKGKGINISLPSLRIDAFSLDVMSRVQDIRKSSLTFAPEAGSQRMRNVINKGLTEEDISTTTKATKKDYDRFSNVAQFISSILFFALCIVLSIILCTSVQVTVLSVLGGVAICLIGIVVFMISTLNFARTIYIGTLRYGKAEELV